MAPVSCVSVASCFPTFFFRVRCCSPSSSLPGALWAQTLILISLRAHTPTHTRSYGVYKLTTAHTHTRLYGVCRLTTTHTPAPPQSLIYSYLMLWCHNSLSGSLAWQPFATRCSWGGKRNAAALLVVFSTIGMEYVCSKHAHSHTHKNRHTILPLHMACCSPLCYEAAD